MPPTLRRLRCALILAAAVSSCGETETPTSASSTDSSTSTTTTAASPTYSEEFVGTVEASGAAFYSFSVTQYGTVNVTLTSVSGQYVPSSLQMGMGLGAPSGTDCTTTTTITTRSGSSPQITGAYQPGVYCVRVHDVGNLFGTASIAVTIAYP